jgi:hypothetical protein
MPFTWPGHNPERWARAPQLQPRESHVLSARPLGYSMVLVVTTLILVPVSMAAEAGTVVGRLISRLKANKSGGVMKDYPIGVRN